MANSDWISNDMIYITGGHGYGVHPTGETVCLGSVESINNILAAGRTPAGTSKAIKETFEMIFKIKREVTNGKQSKPIVQSGRKYRAGKTRDKRIRLTPITKHQSNDFKRTLPGQRLSRGPADSSK
jgi:hypothetical protein